MPEPTNNVEFALREFITTVECTGGVFKDRKGLPRPFADPTWIDLGCAYLNACAALGVEPKVRNRNSDEEG